jgi:hypothetical protein
VRFLLPDAIAVVFASSIEPTLTAGDNATGDIAFNSNAGTMYGSVTLTNNGTINKNGRTIVGAVGGGGTVNNFLWGRFMEHGIAGVALFLYLKSCYS